MKKLKLTTVILLIAAMAYGQGVAINEDGAAPDPSAMLEVTSTEKGILIPRMTQAGRDAILNPANGLMIYQTDETPGFYFYDGSLTPPRWQRFGTDADIFWTSGNGHIHYATGNVGIGTTDPSALLHTHGTSSGGGNVLFSGTFKTTPGDPPATGAGTRMMWYPDKAAFRAGRVTGDQWDKENIGNYSFATGNLTIAKGSYSTATGRSAQALGDYSTAIGRLTEATGDYSTALGRETKAIGENSFATGYRSNATGRYSTAMGRTNAPSFYETSIGLYNTNYTPESETDWNVNDRLFVVGSGTSHSSRSDAMVIMKSGNTGIGTSSPATRLDVNGVITATGGNSELWNEAFNWGDHADAGYLEDEADPTWGGPADQTGDIGRTGNVGIGTISPSALLHTAGTETGEGNVLFTGVYKSSNPGDPPAEGAGTRMMWYPDKAAFRVGIVEGDQWNKDSIGNYSFATGFNSKALGNNSVSIGRFTKALGHSSIAMGSSATASANSAIAMGAILNATGDGSVAIGLQTNAVGVSSVAIGALTTASENYSTAMGGGTTASGYGSTAMGIRTTAASAYETVLGRWNTDYTPASTTEWDENDRLFVVGNGTSIDTRSDALVIMKNGNMGVGTSFPAATLHTNGTETGEGNVLFTGVFKSSDPGDPPASGSGTRMMWYPDKAAFRVGGVTGNLWNINNIGVYSFASGYNTKAEGAYSTAMGFSTSATQQGSFAIGFNSTASGFHSMAMGTSANASAWGSTAIGYGITAPSGFETVIGCFNTTYTPNHEWGWASNDRLFVIGNGTSLEDRSDALVIMKNGNMGVGTSFPAATLHTNGTETGEGNVLFTGVFKSSDPGSPPAEGAGTRMMWYPDKAAFRVGRVTDDRWDKENVGEYSMAFGFGTKASGNHSFAAGSGSQASGDGSTALGVSFASGGFSTAMGHGAIALGNYSTALGNESKAHGWSSTAIGWGTIARSEAEVAIGSNNTDYTPIGGWNLNDRLFVVGNSYDPEMRSDALVILKSGNVGLGTSTPAAQLHTTGSVRFEGTGTPGEGKVLTSDANGNATWQDGVVTYQIGDFAHGGVVFYVEACGTKGLVCAIEDQDGGSGVKWWGGSTEYNTMARGDGIYAGKMNTSIIIAVHTSKNDFDDHAALVCANYTGGGFGDWYLPSKEELNQMYINRTAINNTAIANGGTGFFEWYDYWSSSESNSHFVWSQLFYGGGQGNTGKNAPFRVRAVRAF